MYWTLELGDREMSWFEKLFIVAQKLQARKFLLVTPGNPPPLNLHRAVERGVLWTLKRHEHALRR